MLPLSMIFAENCIINERNWIKRDSASLVSPPSYLRMVNHYFEEIPGLKCYTFQLPNVKNARQIHKKKIFMC